MSTTTITIRPATPADASTWERMRQALWPSAASEHAREIDAFFRGDRRDPAEVLMALNESGEPVGFVELTLRSHAEGCAPGRIAYLEGWFVDEPFRGRGIGAELMRAAEAWGLAQGCTELGSDTEWDNTAGMAAHRALGFTEVIRIACFRKTLDTGSS